MTDACAFDAGITRGACVFIVAVGFVYQEDAAKLFIATVVGTWISIFAGERGGTFCACAVCTGISQGARISIITGCVVGCVDASLLKVAAVIGASVAVVAGRRAGTHTAPRLTDGGRGADVLIIAIGLVSCEDAACFATDVVGTWISIVAFN